jgi:hypothetical protein
MTATAKPQLNKVSKPILVKPLLSEAWHKVKGAKKPLWWALFLQMLVSLLVLVVNSIVHFIFARIGLSALGEVVTLLFSYIILMPIAITIFLLGYAHVKGEPIRGLHALSSLKHWGVLKKQMLLAVVYAIINFVVTVLFFAIAFDFWLTHAHSASFPIGSLIVDSILFVIVFLVAAFVQLSILFAMMLVSDKDLSAWDAFKLSLKRVKSVYFRLIWAVIVMGLVSVLTSCTVILLIWFWPMLVNFYGILYRDVFSEL